jgi:hypothetical protein
MKVAGLVIMCVATGLVTFGIAVLLYNVIPQFQMFLVMGLAGIACGIVDTLIIVSAEKEEGYQ